MSLIAITATASIGLASLNMAGADAPKGYLHMAQAQPYYTTPRISSQSQITPMSDYMTTPDGCTYRRTKAPGYPERWILVLNPHHVGRPNSPRNCKGMM